MLLRLTNFYGCYYISLRLEAFDEENPNIIFYLEPLVLKHMTGLNTCWLTKMSHSPINRRLNNTNHPVALSPGYVLESVGEL